DSGEDSISSIHFQLLHLAESGLPTSSELTLPPPVRFSAMATPNGISTEVRLCAFRLCSLLEDNFILIGASSLAFVGSHRTTDDVDILIPSTLDTRTVYRTLVDNDILVGRSGVFYFS